MIEVEKKFKIEPEGLKHLMQGAELISVKEFTDIYYDNESYTLTLKDIWLRDRAGRFELKFPMKMDEGKPLSHYEEFEDEKSIADKLGLPEGMPFAQALSEIGYKPFATIVTKRMKYKKEGFTIDVDDAGFYTLLEIELMVENKSDMDEAEKKIEDFARMHGLTIGERVRSKLLEYLSRNNPDHVRALESAWQMKL